MAKTSSQRIAAANQSAITLLLKIVLSSLLLSVIPRYIYASEFSYTFLLLSTINVSLFFYLYSISRPTRDAVTGKVVFEGTDLTLKGLTSFAYDTRMITFPYRVSLHRIVCRLAHILVF
jgi:hypothetical protein